MEDLKRLSAYIVDQLKAKGALCAECFAVDETVNELLFSDGSRDIPCLRTYSTHTAKLKAVCGGGKAGTLTLHQTDSEEVEAGIEKVIGLMNGAQEDPFEGICENSVKRSFGTDGDVAADKEAMIQMAEQSAEDKLKNNPGRESSSEKAVHKTVKRVYASTNGALLDQITGFYDISGKFKTPADRLSVRISADAESYDDGMPYGEPEPLGAGFTGTLVLAPRGVKHFWWLMRLCSLNDTALSGPPLPAAAEEQMLQLVCGWIKRIGEKVANESFTLSQRPLDGRFAGVELFTNDGYEAADFDIVKNGVLNAYPFSRKGALKKGRERRVGKQEYGGDIEDYNIVIEPGDIGVGDMIKSVERGMLLFRMGGIPNTDGKIVSNIKQGLMIENGAVKGPVSAIMTADFDEMHMNIRHISKETVFDGSNETPWISYDGVTFK